MLPAMLPLWNPSLKYYNIIFVIIRISSLPIHQIWRIFHVRAVRSFCLWRDSLKRRMTEVWQTEGIMTKKLCTDFSRTVFMLPCFTYENPSLKYYNDIFTNKQQQTHLVFKRNQIIWKIVYFWKHNENKELVFFYQPSQSHTIPEGD